MFHLQKQHHNEKKNSQHMFTVSLILLESYTYKLLPFLHPGQLYIIVFFNIKLKIYKQKLLLLLSF